MDLISRKVAIEEFEDMVTSVSVYGESAEARYATNARLRFIEKLNDIPSVPAVPLDKLCVWLASIPMMNCRVCKETVGFCDGKTNNICGSAGQWKAILTKWMEGLDAEKET